MSGPVTRTRQGAIAALAVTAAAGLTLSGVPQSIANPAPHSGAAASKAGSNLKTSSDDRKGNFDARLGSLKSQLGSAGTLRASHNKAAAALGKSLGPQGIADYDPVTGTPRNLGRLDGFLTSPSSGKASTIVMRYVRSHLAALGLTRDDLGTFTLRSSYVDVGGIHHLSWTQSINGIPVFSNGLKANLTKRGQLISLQGSPVSGLHRTAGKVGTSAKVSAASARELAAKDVGGRTAAASVSTSKSGGVTKWSNHDQAQLVWFVTSSGAHLAWSTYVQAGSSLSYQHVIDAKSGKVLFRHDTVNQDHGDARVFHNYPGLKLGGKQTVINFFKAGFLHRGARKLTHGRYVSAWSDVNDNDKVDRGESVKVPGKKGRAQYALIPFNRASRVCSVHLICTWNPNKANSWRVNRREDVTQGFYYDSMYHNYLKRAPFGFTARAGNFERNGGDPVLLNDLDGANTANGLPDGAHIDNANMDTPPDGIPPTMQMYLTHIPGTTIAQDPWIPTSTSMDPGVILHEYTHGLSNRLVVDAQGNSGLNNIQPRAMGEAWSDYYAMDFLAHKHLLKNTARPGEVFEGAHILAGFGGIRTEAIDCPVHAKARGCKQPVIGGQGGYTYGDFPNISGAPEVHASGEVWSQTLWDLRNRLGHRKADMLITRGMTLSPVEPTMLDMRNAILQADQAVYGSAHRNTIWRVFAHRGMGWYAGAFSGGDVHPAQDFHMPPNPQTPRATLAGIVTDPTTGKPIRNALVIITGHGSGFPTRYADRTDSNGIYQIDEVYPGTYKKVSVFAPGYEIVSNRVKVIRNVSHFTRHDFSVRRDWAASSGGAGIAAFNGPDYTPVCGPYGAIDLAQGTGWGSTTGADSAPITGHVIPKYIVIALPRAIDIAAGKDPTAGTAFKVDPTSVCGDPGSSSTDKFRIDVSTNGTAWTTVSSGSFGDSNNPHARGHYFNVASTKTVAGVNYVRFWMLQPQVPDFATTCPTFDFGGCQFMDMTEIEVFGSPA